MVVIGLQHFKGDPNNENLTKLEHTYIHTPTPTHTYVPPHTAGKKCPFSRELNQNFPPILLNFPPFLYVFLYFRGNISLQMSTFPGNQVPKFPIFSRHAHTHKRIHYSNIPYCFSNQGDNNNIAQYCIAALTAVIHLW